MPRVAAGGVEAPLRRLAPEQAFHGQPPRPSTSSQERRRLFAHRRSPSFSNFEFALEENGDGGGGDGRDTQPLKQQQRQRRERHRSQGLHHPPRCQPRVVDVGCRSVGMGTGRGRTFSYYRLPEHQLRLTIVKLDCSSFDVQVMKSASVLELKLAVEEIFTRSPKGEGMISWSLVWGHFCLCYKDQKLINDKVSLRAFGIKDGDELHFIRHVSVSCCASKQRPRKQRQQKVELVGSEIHQGSEQDAMESDDDKAAGDDSNCVGKHCDNKHGNLVPNPEFKSARPLRGWLSHSGFWFSARAMLGTTFRLSRLGDHCPKAGKR